MQFFGSDAALRECVWFVAKDWGAEPFSGGCYAALMPPGLATTHGGAIRAPHGGLHFASTELARCWPGYIEGAIESGYRAAAEIARVHAHAGAGVGAA